MGILLIILYLQIFWAFIALMALIFSLINAYKLRNSWIESTDWKTIFINDLLTILGFNIGTVLAVIISKLLGLL